MAKAQKNRDKAQRIRIKQANQHHTSATTLPTSSYTNAPLGTTTYTTTGAPLGAAPLGTTANTNLGSGFTTATTNNLGPSANLNSNTQGIGMAKPNYPPPAPPTTARPTL